MDKNDIVLYEKYAFHKSCMEPISERLNEMGIDHLLTSKRYIVYDLFNERKKKYKIFIIADEWGNLFRDQSENLITTGHSMVSKNTTFDPKNSEMDYICVPSPFYKSIFVSRNIYPKKEFWVTGYPAAERIFMERDKPESRETFKLLIAPTYNKDLSVMDFLINLETEESFFKNLLLIMGKKLSKEVDVKFKLHPVSGKKYPEHAEFVLSLLDKYKGSISMVADSHDDISDSVLWADVVLGDCSGALMLGAAAGKPIVAFNNPNRTKSPYFDPNGPEWKYRYEYAHTFDEARKSNDLIDSLFLSYFLDPTYRRREKFVDLIFGEDELRKNASKNIAKKITSLI